MTDTEIDSMGMEQVRERLALAMEVSLSHTFLHDSYVRELVKEWLHRVHPWHFATIETDTPEWVKVEIREYPFGESEIVASASVDHDGSVLELADAKGLALGRAVVKMIEHERSKP